MIATRSFSFLICWALAGCDALPRDPHGTLEHIEKTRQMSVGFIGSSRDAPNAARLVAGIRDRTGARMTSRFGDSDPLLQALAMGELDLVVGQFSKSSPWQTDVAFAPPLSRSGPKGQEIEMKAAVRNGENRWLMVVESASRGISDRAVRR